MELEAKVTDQPLDISRLRQTVPDHPGCGGYVSFEGHVRDINHDRRVTHLEYEAYDLMAEKELLRICEEARDDFGVEWIRVHHRKGRLDIGDPAVSIQVLSRHRKEAFDACQYVISELKVRVPIWKKEFYAEGAPEWTRCRHHHA